MEGDKVKPRFEFASAKEATDNLDRKLKGVEPAVVHQPINGINLKSIKGLFDLPKEK